MIEMLDLQQVEGKRGDISPKTSTTVEIISDGHMKG